MVTGEITLNGIFGKIPPWAKSDMLPQKTALQEAAPQKAQEAAIQETALQEAAHQEAVPQKAAKWKTKKKTRKKKAKKLPGDVHTHIKQVSNNGPLVKVQRQSLPTPLHHQDSGARLSLTSSTLELNSDNVSSLLRLCLIRTLLVCSYLYGIFQEQEMVLS